MCVCHCDHANRGPEGITTNDIIMMLSPTVPMPIMVLLGMKLISSFQAPRTFANTIDTHTGTRPYSFDSTSMRVQVGVAHTAGEMESSVRCSSEDHSLFQFSQNGETTALMEWRVSYMTSL